MRQGIRGWTIAGLLMTTATSAQEPAVDWSAAHATFDVLHLEVAQGLLDEAAAHGFRVIDLTAGFRRGWNVGGYAALLDRAQDAAPGYRILVRDKPDWIADGLNEAAMEGYHLVPDRFFAMHHGTKPFQDEEFVLLLERALPDSGQRHYLALFGDDLRGDPLRVAVQRGYEIVAFAASRDQPVAILEIGFRQEGRDPALEVDAPYRLLEVATSGTLQRRLSEGAADGYRLIAAARPGGDAFYLMRHDPQAAPFSYQLPKKKGLLDALNRDGAAGVRLLPFTWGDVPIQERREQDTNRYAYRLVGAADPDDTTPAAVAQELSTAAAEGFQPVRLTARLQILAESVR